MEELGQAAAFKKAGMKILIVEDEILQAEILTRMLRSWEHEVVSVDGGQQALDRLERDAPDLILLDVFLPDTTAMELIPQLKAIQPDARIITLTGHSNRELERKLRELGISYYMAKPFQRDELHSILVHLAGRPCVQGCRRTANPIINPT
jgi:CheY-like chemotaxis protein